MSSFSRVAMGVLLTGLSVVLSTAAPTLNNGGQGGGTASKQVHGPKAKRLLGAGWRLESPVSFQNLTVFPVVADQTANVRRFITLDEGLRTGGVTIAEIGARGRVRRLARGEEPSDDAEVNQLLLTNRSGKTLVLIAGEIVVGGKQDRIVGHDCLIASTGRPVRLDVFCVEPGRWDEGSTFGQSLPIPSADVARGRGGAGGRGDSTGSAPAQLGGLTESVTLFASNSRIAPTNVREKAQAVKDQDSVWAEVAKSENATSTSSSTGNLNAVFENVEVKTGIESYDEAFAGKLSEKRIVGVVVAIAGKIRAADVFASPVLFRAYWPKLLKSYSLEAISSDDAANITVAQSAAEDFLSRVKGRRSQIRRRTYRLVEQQTDSEASFELVTGSKRPVLIHFNRVTKQVT